MSNLQQLTLNLYLRDDATFANFYASGNEAAVGLLQAMFANDVARMIYLWGKPGSGCTHLLMSACNYFSAQNLRCIYLSLRDLQQTSPAILENLEDVELLCIDDLGAVLGDKQWENALFTCFNRVAERQTRMLVAAYIAPQQALFELPDLQSRMAGGVVLQVYPLLEEQKALALQMRARALGIELAQNVAVFLLHTCDGNLTQLFSLLGELSHAALAAKRRITIPFVKSVIYAVR